MKWIGLAAAVVVLHQVHAVTAYACTPLPAVVSPLLPLDGATEVGVDAVLIASGNAGEPLEFELLAAAIGDAGQDAGGERVELAVDCGQGSNGGGYLCIAKPVVPLLSHARYEWRAISSLFGSSNFRSFVTSDVRTVPFELPSFDARVVSERISDSPCGGNHSVTLDVKVGEFDGLAVLSAPGVLPSLYVEPVVLTEGNWSQQLLIPLPPPCFELELIAPNGERRSVAELCTPSSLVTADAGAHTGGEHTVGPPSDGDTDEPAESAGETDGGASGIEPKADKGASAHGISESRSGCTVGLRSPGYLAWLSGVAVVCSAAWRRRGVRRKSVARS